MCLSSCYSGEIDNDMLIFIRSLKAEEKKRRQGLEGMIAVGQQSEYDEEDDNNNNSLETMESNPDEEENYREEFINAQLKANARAAVDSENSPAFYVLDLIEKRIKAEMLSTSNKNDIRLLADLLQVQNSEVRSLLTVLM
jgi:hypothetical protein